MCCLDHHRRHEDSRPPMLHPRRVYRILTVDRPELTSADPVALLRCNISPDFPEVIVLALGAHHGFTLS